MNRSRDLAASVRARLLNKARSDGVDVNLLLTRYALERLLFRLSVSGQSGQFLLKGALLFDLWFDLPRRPTHDADLLGFGSAQAPQLEQMFREIGQIACDDGIVFPPERVQATEIRKDANYPGVRLAMQGLLDGARCPMQIDIGFGDAVVPGPQEATYPLLLDDMPAARLRVYPRHAVVAEKLQAVVSLGMLNSRLKDYFDLWVLTRHGGLDPAVLGLAIAATFERRATPLPRDIPLGLSEEFSTDEQKVRQWQAFLRKNDLQAPTLPEVVASLRQELLPVLASLISRTP